MMCSISIENKSTTNTLLRRATMILFCLIRTCIMFDWKLISAIILWVSKRNSHASTVVEYRQLVRRSEGGFLMAYQSDQIGPVDHLADLDWSPEIPVLLQSERVRRVDFYPNIGGQRH